MSPALHSVRLEMNINSQSANLKKEAKISAYTLNKKGWYFFLNYMFLME